MSKSLARPKPIESRAAATRAGAPAVRGRAKKISLTVDERVLAEVERSAAHAGRSLSAYVTEALARDLRRKQLQDLIDEYEAEHGAITERELARIRSKWQG
jgi:hypothetical protein